MGKITVKHYLNKKLKPEIDKYIENGKEIETKIYPLYISITVSSKNVKIKSNLYNFEITEKDFENNFSENILMLRKIKHEKQIYEAIVKKFLNEIEKKISVINQQNFSSFALNENMQSNKNTDVYTYHLYKYIQQYTTILEQIICDKCMNILEDEVYNLIKPVFKLEKHRTIKDYVQTRNINDQFLIMNIDQKKIIYLVLYNVYLSYSTEYKVAHGLNPTLIENTENNLIKTFSEFILSFDFSTPYYALFKIDFSQNVKNELINLSNKIISSWIKENL